MRSTQNRKNWSAKGQKWTKFKQKFAVKSAGAIQFGVVSKVQELANGGEILRIINKIKETKKKTKQKIKKNYPLRRMSMSNDDYQRKMLALYHLKE